MFERAHHRRIASVLRAFNVDLLEKTRCYFGGGTAIVLLLSEYRQSLDIDFLCASSDGYRQLRNLVTPHHLGPLLSPSVQYLRDVRADRYGIRTVLAVDGIPIKIELVSEGRIPLQGGTHPSLHVPTLSREDMYAEKLLANADRGLDKSTMSRDIIDLAMMIESWGRIPERAWDKAKAAYGDHVVKAFAASVRMLHERSYLKHCLQHMDMDDALAERIPILLERAATVDLPLIIPAATTPPG